MSFGQSQTPLQFTKLKSIDIAWMLLKHLWSVNVGRNSLQKHELLRDFKDTDYIMTFCINDFMFSFEIYIYFPELSSGMNLLSQACHNIIKQCTFIPVGLENIAMGCPNLVQVDLD